MNSGYSVTHNGVSLTSNWSSHNEGFRKRDMKYYALLVMLLLCAKAPCYASSSAIELAAQLEEGDQWLKIQWTNKEGTTLLCLGGIVGNSGINPAIRLFLSDSGKKAEELINTDQPGVIGGRSEPLVIYMPPRSEYAIRVDTRKLFLPGYSKTVWSLRTQPWTLVVRYRGVVPEDSHAPPCSGPKPYNTLLAYPVNVHFWTGEAATQIVHHPIP